jgi:hypothetical protein
MKIANPFGNKGQKEEFKKEELKRMEDALLELKKFQLEHKVRIVPCIQQTADNANLPSVITKKALWYLRPMSELEISDLEKEIQNEENANSYKE